MSEEDEREVINRLIDRCNNCDSFQCIECGIVWTEVQAISNYINKIQKYYQELQEENQRIKDINVELNTDLSAWKTTAKELEEEIRDFIKKELPDDEIMECCSNYDVNGVAIRKELEKILCDIS